MIIASAGATGAVGGVIQGWDNAAPYNIVGFGFGGGSGGGDDGGGRGARFYIKAYPGRTAVRQGELRLQRAGARLTAAGRSHTSGHIGGGQRRRSGRLVSAPDAR